MVRYRLAHHQADGETVSSTLQRITRTTVGLSTLNFAVVAAVTLLDPTRGPVGDLARTWVIACIVADAVVAMVWFVSDVMTHGVAARAFGIWADVGTASVLITFADPGEALVGCVLFAVTGAFFTFYLPRSWMRIHVVFVLGFILLMAALSVRDGMNWPTVIARTDVVIAGVLGLPMTIQIVWASQRRRARLSEVDALTRIANRRGLDRYVESVSRTQPRGVLGAMVIDVDYFKSVNDEYGHDTGDRVLVAVAQALVEAVGDAGTVARNGGEEFAVFLALDAAYELDATTVLMPVRVTVPGIAPVGLSIGVASVSIRASQEMDASTAWRLLAAADEAMYRAKARGGARIESVDLAGTPPP